jgi:hypothetical protein
MDAARQEADWNHTALLACLLFNANRDPKKTAAATPATFNPYSPRPKRIETPKVRLRDLKSAYVR